MLRQLESLDPQSTHAMAAALARQCRRGDCVLLRGDLGSGKTTFARGFIQALLPKQEEVVSPTFTLVQTYPGSSGDTIWHFDLYRLRSAREINEIGLEEALDSGITLIEWPEILENALPEAALSVTITMESGSEMRKLTFAGPPERWESRLNALEGVA